MTVLAFIDTETTGLDPDRHLPWEIALILRRPGQPDVEQVIQFGLTGDETRNADPMALRVGRYFDRISSDAVNPWDRPAICHGIARALCGAVLIGATVSFDAAMLRSLLHANGYPPTWDYHLCNVTDLAFGAWGEGTYPPYRFDDACTLAGLPPISADERHTALGDARAVRDLFDRATA